jgi:hypothetical protein
MYISNATNAHKQFEEQSQIVQQFADKPNGVIMAEMIDIFICATDVLVPAGLEYIFTSVSLFLKNNHIK